MACASHTPWLSTFLAVVMFSFIVSINSQFDFSPPPPPDLSIDKVQNSISAAVVAGIVVSVVSLIVVAFLIYKCVHIVDRNTRQGIPHLSIHANPPPSASPLPPAGFHSLPPNVEEHLSKLCYGLDEVREMTSNFRIKLGEGGFGAVYHGNLKDGTQVAVKKLSMTSAQGLPEFLNEVVILSRARHKNLVSMIGYCCESNERCLIYEFMSKGNLEDRLHGLPSEQEPLDWLMRLKIAIGAAKGFSYLHNDCEPSIIHRDVKSSNILLDDKFVAKVADFGLSKLLTQSSLTHVSTKVKGTFGYLDPEYAQTQRLSEKSDVYSFGVILLELLSGKQAIIQHDGEYIHVAQWAKPFIMSNMMESFLDKHLGNISNKKSIQKVANISLKCVASKGYERPDFNEVLQVLQASLELELPLRIRVEPSQDNTTPTMDKYNTTIPIVDHSKVDSESETIGFLNHWTN